MAPTGNLADRFEAVVDRAGDREAVVTPDRRLTFTELDERASRVAHLLASFGVAAGDRVGIALPNGHQHIEGLLGAYKLRAVPFNVNYRYTAPELAHLLGDAGPRVVLHGATLSSAIADAVAVASGGGRVTAVLAEGAPYEVRLAEVPATRPEVLGRSGDDGYLIYTGGTTGMPKGVEWRHEDIYAAALGGGIGGVKTEAGTDADRLSSNRVALASPLVHGTAQWVALSTLLAGGTVLPLTTATFEPVDLWDLAAAESASVVVIVGDAFARPLVDALRAHPDRWDLTGLVAVVSGGAQLSPSVRADLAEMLPSAAVVDGYGTSETGGQGNAVTWPGQDPDPATRFPLDAHTAVLGEDGSPLVGPIHAGSVGPIARTGHIPRRYRNDPERTAATFPVLAGRQWAVPGDLGRIEHDGTVTLLGRGTTSINTGGEKVFPDEVEAMLKAHPAVFDAAVVGVPDPRWGERVVALVSLRPGGGGDGVDLEGHCRDGLAPFKVPRRTVVVDSIRRAPSGKLDQAWARSVAVAGPEEVPG